MAKITGRESLKAAFWYIVTNFISKAILYICTPIYTRMLSTFEYGQYSNFISWQSILVILFTFDLSSAVSIAFYDYDKEESFSAFINTITILSYLIPSAICTIMLLLGDLFSRLFTIKKEYLPILAGYIIFNNTINIFQAEQRVRVRYKVSAILTVLSSIVTVATIISFAFLFNDKLWGILTGGTIVYAIVSLGLAVSIFKRNHAVKLEYAKYAFSIAIPLVPHALANTILGSSDKVMITKYCGEEYTAFYNLAFIVSMVITMVAASINKAWTPWFFERLKMNRKEKVRPVSKIIVFMICFFSAVICILAPEFVLIIGGKNYVHSAIVMPPIVASCLINCVTTFYINIEFYNKKTVGISVATMLSAMLNLLTNYIFINKFGYVAAAYTTLFSSFLTLAFHIYQVKRQKMLDIFDNRFFIAVVILFTVLTELAILAFPYLWLRVCLAFITVVLFMVKVYKDKHEILYFIKGMNSQY